MSNYPWYTLFNSNDNNIYSYASVKDTLNNIYVVGNSDSKLINIDDKQYSRNSDGIAAYIVKLDDDGAPVWFHWIDGSNMEGAHSIVVDTNNNVYVVGYSRSESVIINGIANSKNNNTLAGYIIKFDQNGNILKFNWLDGAISEIGYALTIDKLNNIYITGVSNSNSIIQTTPTRSNVNSNKAGFLIKMSSDLMLIWIKWIDGVGNDDLYSIVLDSNSNIYIAGNSTSNILKINDNNSDTIERQNNINSVYLIKLNNEGNYIWGIWINGDDTTNINDLTCDNNDFIYLIGNSISKIITINNNGYNRTNDTDIFTSYVFKMNIDDEHAVEWFKWIQGDHQVDMYSLKTDNSNNVYITGSTNSAYLTIDDQVYENMSSNNNGFLIKINPFGDIDWSRWLFSYDANNYSPNIYISDILIDKKYNLYMTGYTNATDIEFNNEIILSKSGTSYNTFVFKYNLNNITLEEGLKSCIILSNEKYIIYKSLFYFLLFVIYIYIIWLLYKNNVF
jgi:hypothetical protein